MTGWVLVGGGAGVVVLVVMILAARRLRALRSRQRRVLSGGPRPVRLSIGDSWARLAARVAGGPRWLVTLGCGAFVAAAGFLAAGGVAAFALGVYAMVAVATLHHRRAGVRDRQTRSALLDRLAGLAADLRAGRPVPSALGAAGLDPEAPHPAAERPVRELTDLALAASVLAERTGAPLADLVERIEADARATDRTLAAAAAQSAGAHATALLLAALPIGGLALGYAIGVDPLATLLHTPLGAACTAGAVTLQTLGLLWTSRLQPRPR